MVEGFLAVSSVATKGLGGAVPRGPKLRGPSNPHQKIPIELIFLKISSIFKINMTGGNTTLIMATQFQINSKVIKREFS